MTTAFHCLRAPGACFPWRQRGAMRFLGCRWTSSSSTTLRPDDPDDSVDATWVGYTALEQVTYALIEHDEIPWWCACVVVCGRPERAQATTRRIRLKTNNMAKVATLMVTI
jgi:hypothetical protein